MPRLSRSLLVILIASVAGACSPGYLGDAGYAVWFRNESNTPVIVQFIEPAGTDGTGFFVGAGSIGGSYAGLGVTTWSAYVRIVVAASCMLLWERDVRGSPSGAIVVDASGVIRLATGGPASIPESSEIPIAALPETKDCLPKGVDFYPQDAYPSAVTEGSGSTPLTASRLACSG